MTRVLIVDDRPEGPYVLRELLQRHDCEVEDARHGAEALARARQHPPDLVITDLLMPVMDGYTLLGHWKADERLRQIPVVVYTATYTEPNDEQLALDLGADAFILEPAEPGPFIARIRDLLAKKAGGALPPAHAPRAGEKIVLKEYNEVLVRKLEEKVLQLAQANRDLTRRNADRERAEAALHATETRYRALVEHAADAIFVAGIDGRLQEANSRACEMLGYSPQELVGLPLSAIVTEAERARQAADFRRVLAGERVISERQYRRKDGTVFPGELSVCLLAPNLLLGIARDITERKRAEETQRASAERLRLAVTGADLGTCHWNIRTGELVWSDRCLAILGIPPGTPMSYEQFLAALHPDDRARADAAMKRALAERREYDIEFRTVWPDGSVHWAAAKGRGYYDAAGQPVRVEGLTLDITERRQAEEALRRSHEQILSFVEQAPIAIAMFDREMRYLVNSRQWLVDFGRGLSDLTGRSHYDVHPDLPERWKEVHRRALAGETLHNDDDLWSQADGTKRWLRWAALPWRDAQGEIGGIIISTEDITDRKRAEAESRRQAQRLALATQSAHMGIWDWDVVANKLVWDTQMYALYGLREQDFGGTVEAWQMGVHPEDRDRATAEVAAALDGTGDFHTQFRVVWPGGEVRQLEAHGVVQRASNGSALHMIGANWDITDRKQAEAALRESEAKFRAICDAAPIGIFLVRPDGHVTYGNPADLRLTGLSWEDTMGLNWIKAVHPDDRAQVVAEWQACCAAGRPYAVTGRYLHADGQVVWWDVTTAPVRDGDTLLGYVGLVVDITERRRAEAALRESEEKFSKAFHSNPAMVVMSTLDGKNVDFNQAYASFLGHSRGEMVGKSVTDLQMISAEERQAILDIIQGAGGSVRNVEVPVRTRDGHVLHVLLSSETISLGGVPHRLTTLLDITERKQAEYALRESEARTRLLIQSSNIGLWDWHLGTNEIYFSPEWKQQLGYADHEVPNRYDEWANRLHPGDRERVQNFVQHCLDGRRRSADVEFRLCHKDGSWRWILGRPEVVRDAAGTPVRMIGCHIDITDRKEAEAALKLAHHRLQSLSGRLLEIQETERRQLAAELHDEIGQALTAIKINLESLRRFPDPSAAGIRLDESVAIVDRSLQQVRSLSLELRPALLDDLGLVPALRWLADQHAKRAGLHLKVDGATADARFDPAVEIACFRVAQEALNNIVRHAGARNVTVELRVRGDELDLVVRDDGVGFDAADARSRAAQGRSLGLAGMEERALLAGGGIEWCSTRGQGTQVHAWFGLHRAIDTSSARSATL